MSKNRTDNTIKNIAAALFVQLAITALSFVTRSVLIRVLGFGPSVQVTSPESFLRRIRARIAMQPET